MPDFNKNVFRQENTSGSGQRFRTIDYKPLSDFNSGSCMVYTIDVPDVAATDIVPVFNTKSKTMQYFHTTEKKEAVSFKVCYTPFNNANGKKLLTNVKKLVDSVLTKNFKSETATINILRNGVIERTIAVNDTVIVDGRILIDLHDFVRIEFTLCGILADS
jgi:hypothetical protein